MKRLIQRIARKFGLRVERIDPRHDGFDVQRRLMPNAKLIFDVGANVGNATKSYRELFPAAHIHCFEPDPAAAAQIPAGPRVTVHRVAASDVDGTSSFNIARHSEINSLLPVAVGGEQYLGGKANAETVRAIEVETITLDRFCASRGIDRVDVMKIDVQGAECMVFDGASEMLAGQAFGIVYAEVAFSRQYDGGAGFREIWSALEQHGYRLFQLYDLDFGTDMFLSYGNAVFISPAVAKTISPALWG
jgi:FkbM family methyltransferase